MKLRQGLTLLVAAGAASLAAPGLAAQGREVVNPRAVEDGGLPFSGAVWVGDMLYLSGTIGLLPDQTVPEAPEEEARLVLDSVKGTLEAAGLTMDDLVSVQVFCSDVAHYAAFNEVYRTYFTGTFPARAFVGVGTLLFDARFEVQAIASRR